MTVFTYSKARQNFSSLLDIASKDGEVLIRRRDGRLFSVRPQIHNRSPFDVAGIKTKVTTREIIEAVRESRNRP